MVEKGSPGEVLLLLLIDENGKVEQAVVVCSTDDSFSKVAVSAAKNNRYAPAIYDGRALRTAVSLPYSYRVSP